MSNSENKNFQEIAGNINSNVGGEPKQRRRRSPTLLKMQWLAERVRKSERIRKQVQDGTYKAESSDVARALLGIDIG